jgi:hypothetical protein
LRCASMISLLRQSSKRFHWWVPSLCTTVWMNQGRCRWRLNHANSESLFKLFAENPTSTEASSHFLVYCISYYNLLLIIPLCSFSCFCLIL